MRVDVMILKSCQFSNIMLEDVHIQHTANWLTKKNVNSKYKPCSMCKTFSLSETRRG